MKNQKHKKELFRRLPPVTAVLAVSFGTACLSSREMDIGAAERAIAARFPDYEVRSACSSRTVIGKLKARYGLETDGVKEALERAACDGVRRLAVQPLYLSDGYEYAALEEMLKEYSGSFERIVLGRPLLASDADIRAAAGAVAGRSAEYDDGRTAVCFMGHGSAAVSDQVYEKLQEALAREGYEHYYIAAMKEKPSLDDMRMRIRKHGGYQRIVLQPFLITAGRHARLDMAGMKEDSWKNILSGDGYEVICLLEGLGRCPAIQNIYVLHVRDAVEKLKMPG